MVLCFCFTTLHLGYRMPIHRMIAYIIIFTAGIMAGGYLFSQSTPRILLPLENCQNRCYTTSEIAGLLTSAAILRVPFLIPRVVLESDTCLAIRYPKDEAIIHYVLFPKHDTKNIATLTLEDSPYVMGCFALAKALIVRDNLKSYRLTTNGPALQDIAYLHFHLVSH